MVKRVRQPSLVHVAPDTTYSSILLFEVNSSFVSYLDFF